MLEKEKIRFFDTERLTETKDFSAHCKTSYLQSALKDRFPDMKFQVTSASINQTGMYVSKEAAWIKLIGGDNRIRNLPPYCEVTIDVSTGRHTQTIIIWEEKRSEMICWRHLSMIMRSITSIVPMM